MVGLLEKLRSLYLLAPLLLLLDGLLLGLLPRPLRRENRALSEGVLLGLLDRGETERQGERETEGVGECTRGSGERERVRVRPRDGDLEGIVKARLLSSVAPIMPF